jgi:hypothetical protein
MNAEERQALLIDYAEGMLPKEQAAEMESFLSRSPDAREELAVIRSAFQQLNELPAGSVPDHYFSNFLPRLRENLEHGRRRREWNIPAFMEWLVRPAMVAAGLLVFITAYRSFEPRATASPIYDLVSEFAQDEINALLNEPLLVDIGSDDASVEIPLGSEAFGADGSQYQSENDLTTSLEEQDLEQVVQRLETKARQ